MSNIRTTVTSLAADVFRMIAALTVLSAVVGAGIHGVSGELFATVPDVEFDYGYDAETATLSITHAGGDPLPADAVRVVGTDAACDAGPWGQGRVTADDTCRLVGVTDDRPVRVVWHDDGTDRAVLDVWVGPPE
ncbi:hypothetical protein BRC88_03445 [Halobacteriales archaeon QS_4_69_225]|nr:MAG: hypothetical protein BRC88_03445 [Halobacteriales archaeon QS_4_69_225]